MIFSSLTFFVFFLAILLLYSVAQNEKQRAGILLVGSIIYYSSWKLAYVPLFLFILIFNFWIYKYLLQNKSKPVFICAVAFDLAVLAFFKYLVLFTETILWFLNIADISTAAAIPAWMNWVLPLGISFYTFQMISALADVYKERCSYQTTFPNWCLYVSFFPKLIAGPIVRANSLLPQLDDLKPVDVSNLRIGTVIFVGGLLKKVFLADNIAPIVDELYAHPDQLNIYSAWLGTLGYALQIYFDFSGYSEMAVGLARMLGIELPINFLFPYISRNSSEFWRRWHITLSEWLRDYLYIPMGGSRCSSYRTYQNLLVTMLLAGLWHGAGWGFIFWGFLHGLYLAGYRMLTKFYNILRILPDTFSGKIISWIGLPVTFILINIAWVFFRAPDFSNAWQIIYATSGLAVVNELKVSLRLYQLSLLALGYFVVFSEPAIVKLGKHLYKNWWWNVPFPIRGVVYASIVLFLLVFGGHTQKFVYFDF